MRQERIINKLIVKQQEQTVSEEQRIAKAVSERDAKQAQQQLVEKEKRANMLKSIAEHREVMVTHIKLLRLITKKCIVAFKSSWSFMW